MVFHMKHCGIFDKTIMQTNIVLIFQKKKIKEIFKIENF